MNDEPLFAEKYRPKTVEEAILPKSIKQIFSSFVENNNFPNLLLSGRSGLGKTTIAKALCNELGYDYIFINGSSERNIDVVRSTIVNFASTVSMTSDRKCVIIDECLEENEEILCLDDEDNKCYIKLKDMVIGKQYRVLSYNLDTNDVEADSARIISIKEDYVYEVELEDGRTILATDNHPFIITECGKNTTKTIKDGLSELDDVVVIM